MNATHDEDFGDAFQFLAETQYPSAFFNQNQDSQIEIKPAEESSYSVILEVDDLRYSLELHPEEFWNNRPAEYWIRVYPHGFAPSQTFFKVTKDEYENAVYSKVALAALALPHLQKEGFTINFTK